MTAKEGDVMTWSYRIIRSKGGDGQELFALYECFYNDEGGVEGWTESAVSLDGFGSIKELQENLRMMLEDAGREPLELAELEPPRGGRG